MSYRAWFAEWFSRFNPVDNDWLKNLGLHTTVENSPWHREENVWVHTKMVVNEYFKLMGDREWTVMDVYGGLACAFHDVGKPDVKEVVVKDNGEVRNRFGGHEQRSACLWRDYLTRFPDEFAALGEIKDIFYPVAWLIETHLPYAIKDADKRNAIATTIDNLNMRQTFFNVLMADARGRISDDHEQKIKNVQQWIAEFPLHNDYTSRVSPRTLVLLIGLSGSGKTTYVNQNWKDASVFSYDALRLQWYADDSIVDAKDMYQHCFKKSTEDSKFNEKTLAVFNDLVKHSKNDIVVDNMNMSAKSRRPFVTIAKQHGFIIKAVIFVVAKDTINARQKTRPDKYLGEKIIDQQYNSMSVPNYGDVSVIEVVVN